MLTTLAELRLGAPGLAFVLLLGVSVLFGLFFAGMVLTSAFCNFPKRTGKRNKK